MRRALCSLTIRNVRTQQATPEPSRGDPHRVRMHTHTHIYRDAHTLSLSRRRCRRRRVHVSRGIKYNALENFNNGIFFVHVFAVGSARGLARGRADERTGGRARYSLFLRVARRRRSLVCRFSCVVNGVGAHCCCCCRANRRASRALAAQHAEGLSPSIPLSTPLLPSPAALERSASPFPSEPSPSLFIILLF